MSDSWEGGRILEFRILEGPKLCEIFERHFLGLMSLFGVVVPGRPVITDFQVLDAQRCAVVLDQPALITEITFFLVPPGCIPPGYGAILYYSVPPFTNWVLLGAIMPEKPSGIFKTGWTTNEEVRHHAQVQIGISIEP